MVDVSIDNYSADESENEAVEENSLKNSNVDSDNETIIMKKKRRSRLKVKEDSDYDTDENNERDHEPLTKKNNKNKRGGKIDKSEKKDSNNGKVEGDSCVSGISSDSSSDDENEDDFVERLTKKKESKEPEKDLNEPKKDLNEPKKDTSLNIETEQDTSLNNSVTKQTMLDSSEDEMYNEIVKQIPSKKTVEKKETPKKSKSPKRKSQKKKNRKIESDDSDSNVTDSENNVSDNDNKIKEKLQNFSDSEDDEGKLQEEDMKDLEQDKQYLDEENIKPLKKRKAAKESEKAMKEIRSEQQRLQRERACEIPYHEPKAKSVKEFLKRVPSLPNRRNKVHGSDNTIELGEESDKPQESSQKSSIFSRMPVLTQNSGDMEFIMEDDVPSAPKPIKHVNTFMKKVAKHIKVPVAEKKTDSSFEKGWSNTQLKTELRGKIKEKRQKQYEEYEEKRKRLEDQIALEDGDESFDEADGLSDSSESAESEDEEIEKWNTEDTRIRLEEDLEAEEKNKNSDEKTTSKEDGSNDDVLAETSSEAVTEDVEDIDFKKVPTQLLKSDLLHSNSNSDFEKKDSFLSLPCENTQDLYKDDSKISSQPDSDEEDSDTELGPNFHLSLDEDTQFTQHILDSQGFLTNKKQAPKEKAKIFEGKQDEPANSTFSMTQMLGLCSGKFSDNNSSSFNTSPTKNPATVNHSSLDFQDENANSTFSNFTFTDSKEEDNVVSTQKASERNFPSEDEEKEKVVEEDSLQGQLVSAEKEEKEVIKSSGDVKEDHDTKEINDEKKHNEIEEASENEKIDEELGDELEAEEADDDKEFEDAPVKDDDENVEEKMEEGEEEEEDVEEDNEELREWNLHVQQGETKKKWKKKAFYEEEAELSGSDVGSDDEDEVGSGLDEYEEDSDLEDLPDDEKLKKQLHKIHQKKMNDQDKREMRLLQELYLEDEFGDSERRKRNFRWRNIDENLNDENGSNDVDEADNYSELKERNKELVERNKYLLELEESQSKVIELDENSQMVLGKINAPGLKTFSSSQPLSAVDVSQKITPLRRSGSFLRDVKNSKPSPMANLPKAPTNKSTKSFVFQALDEPKKVKKTSDDHHAPPRKRARNENTPATTTTPKLTANSIFSLL